MFAGCGGLSDGFESTNLFNGIAHIEWEKPALDTLEKRLINKYKKENPNCIYFDIQRIDELFNGYKEDLKFGSFVGLTKLVKNHGVDIVIGGPPCQAYSLAGRIRDKDGMQNDYRNYLFESYIEVLKKTKPKLFVFENVPGMLSAAPGGFPITQRIRDAFDKSGYLIIDDLKKALIDMTDFGVPQNRKRVILVGLLKSQYKKDGLNLLEKFYEEFKDKFKVKKINTAQNALRNLPSIFPKKNLNDNSNRQSHELSNKSKIENHIPRFHNQRDIEIFRILTNDIQTGKNLYVSTDSLKKLYTEKTGKTSSVHKYFVIRPNKPSNTIPSHLYKDGLRHIHWDPKQARSLTVRECARLQGFDDDFIFYGSQGDQYKMIGNAVPPIFAKLLANHIFNFFKK